MTPSTPPPPETRPAEMQAGRELDALVAEKVMGLVLCQAEHHQSEGVRQFCHARPDSPMMGGETQTYSTDIAAAWLVVEKMRKNGWTMEFTNQDIPHVMFWQRYKRADGIGRGHRSAPLAICLAALLAASSPSQEEPT